MDRQSRETSLPVELPTAEIRHGWLRELSPDLPIPKCIQIKHFRTGGPGGQKRNKTSSGVRLIHRPTGLSGDASEERSQAINLRRAVERLRLRIAFHVRCPPRVPPPTWWHQVVGTAGGLSRRDPLLAETAAILLDVMDARGFALRESASDLQLSTARLSRLLREIPGLLNHVNSQRRMRSLKTLGG